MSRNSEESHDVTCSGAYTTNYGGPLRKSRTANFQLIATVLINVCYRIYADVRPFAGPPERLPATTRRWHGTNCTHAYQ
jgi:CRISPR-associated protein Cas5d